MKLLLTLLSMATLTAGQCTVSPATVVTGTAVDLTLTYTVAVNYGNFYVTVPLPPHPTPMRVLCPPELRSRKVWLISK